MNGAYFRVQPSPQLLVPLRSLFLRLLQQAPTTGGGASPWKREGKGARAMHFYVQSLQEGEGAGRGTGARVRWAVRRFASMQLVRSVDASLVSLQGIVQHVAMLCGKILCCVGT